MTERLRRHIDILRAIKSCSKKQRKALLESASKDQVHCLCECVLNVLNGNVPIDCKKKEKLRKYKKVLYQLSIRKGKKKKGYWANKKNLLIQRGGFLPVLLGPILGIASSILSNLISK